jgi:iron complex outermembrane receptor protein
MQHITEQTHVPPTGNIKVTDAAGNTTMQPDYMAPPPAYSLFNAEATTAIDVRKRRIELVLSATNIFNVSYRDYMNAFRYFSLDRGRNIAIKIKLTI